MLKLTYAYATPDRPVFIRPSDIVAVQNDGHETLVTVKGAGTFEVKEDAEEIARYLCEKNNYSGNNQYDTLQTRVIERDEDAFDTVDVALSYAAKYIEKRIEDKEGEYLNAYHQLTLDNIKRMQRTLASVTLREVE